MAKTTIEAVVQNRIIPVITFSRLSQARPLAEVLELAGMKVIEITLRTESAMEAIELLAQNSNLLIGAGSVTSVEQMEKVRSIGASFAVSPGIQMPLVEAAFDSELNYLPGVSTPSEIMLGLSLGLNTLKFFPSETLGGVSALKAMSAPFPGMSFIPTGGIDASNAKSYLDLENVKAVGGSWMVSSKLLEAENYEEISKLARAAMELCANPTTEGTA